MTFEQDAAYALASWGRFEAVISDDLLCAVTSAFVLVAVADGDLAETEIDRFMRLLEDHSDAFRALDIAEVDRVFRDLGGALFSSPDAGRGRALAHISAIAGNEVHCDLVRSAAEIAVLADNRDLATERSVLTEICAAMGVTPR